MKGAKKKIARQRSNKQEITSEKFKYKDIGDTKIAVLIKHRDTISKALPWKKDTLPRSYYNSEN